MDFVDKLYAMDPRALAEYECEIEDRLNVCKGKKQKIDERRKDILKRLREAEIAVEAEMHDYSMVLEVISTIKGYKSYGDTRNLKENDDVIDWESFGGAKYG